MKKINYLLTLFVMLFGLTINAQITGLSENGGAITLVANAEMPNTLIIGSNTVNSSGVDDAKQNTGFGFLALDGLREGDSNTAMGYMAGTAIGGQGTGSGTSNTLIGNKSGYQISTGSYNVAIGGSTAAGLMGGQKNTFIGNGSKPIAPGNNTALHRIGIGNATQVSADKTAVIGNNLTIDVYFGGMLSSGNAGKELDGSTSGDEWNATLHATALTLKNSETITNATDGTVVISGNLSVSSDMRLKDDIESLGSTMSDILKLDGKSYTRDGRPEIGFLAQDVELVYPELVSADGNGMLAVNYQALSAILLNGVKDQEARIAKLELIVHLLLNKK